MAESGPRNLPLAAPMSWQLCPSTQNSAAAQGNQLEQEHQFHCTTAESGEFAAHQKCIWKFDPDPIWTEATLKNNNTSSQSEKVCFCKLQLL